MTAYQVSILVNDSYFKERRPQVRGAAGYPPPPVLQRPQAACQNPLEPLHHRSSLLHGLRVLQPRRLPRPLDRQPGAHHAPGGIGLQGVSGPQGEPWMPPPGVTRSKMRLCQLVVPLAPGLPDPGTARRPLP